MQEAHSVQELTALLVEPSPVQAKIIISQLMKQGVAHVDKADSGQAALEMMRRSPPSVVISALYLPDMSGTQLLGAMRDDPALAEMPFILVSSETRPQVLDPVRQSGVCGIVPKPFSDAQLAQALRATLDLLGQDDSLEQAGIDLENIRVLLVDDSSMARKYIRRVLANLGIIHFIEADNGAEAIQKLDREMVDFVVTDYNMPEMDGKALIEYIRNQSWQRSVPVLMVTSESDQGRLAAVQELGVVGVCDKPFEPSMVKQLLGKMLAETPH